MGVVRRFQRVRTLLVPLFLASCCSFWQAHGSPTEEPFKNDWVVQKPMEISIMARGVAERSGPPREDLLYVGKATVDVAYRGLRRDLLDTPCRTDLDCINDLQNFDIVENDDTNITQAPFCKDSTQTDDNDGEEGFCRCEPGYCESYSRTYDGKPFYYCGPCGRVGSECRSTNGTCMHELAECRGEFCECIQDGIFYELYFCYVPYYGYEVALQMAITTCIVIALCLLIASAISFFGRSHRLNRLQRLARWRRGSEVTQSPPGDSPPTYDDVVEKLPSYQDALAMLPDQTSTSEGIENPSFTNDEAPPPTYEVSLQGSNAAASTHPSATALSCSALTAEVNTAAQGAEPSPDKGGIATPQQGEERANEASTNSGAAAMSSEVSRKTEERASGAARGTLQPIEAVLHDALSRS